MTSDNKKTPTDIEVSQKDISIVAEKPAVVKQTADIDGFLAKRKEFIEKVNAICVEGKDYHIIQGKKSLAKGGAEKIASIFQWNATFIRDHEAIEMLGQIAGLVAFKCTLCKGTKFVGEGRGAATLQKNGSDPNKTLKMAQKSAFIDAVLRSSGLSDFYTQDLEDMKDTDVYSHTTSGAPEGSPAAFKSFPASPKQLELIEKLLKQKSISKEQMIEDGFDMDNLTGGKDGTASEAIEHLFKFSSYSSGLTPLNDEGKLVLMFTQDLDKCETPQEYELVCNNIRIARDNGKIDKDSYAILIKVANNVVAKFNK